MKKLPLLIVSNIILLGISTFLIYKVYQKNGTLHWLSACEQYIRKEFYDRYINENFLLFSYIEKISRQHPYIIFVPEYACCDCLDSLLMLFKENSITPENVCIINTMERNSPIHSIALKHSFTNFTDDGYTVLESTIGNISVFFYDSTMQNIYTLNYYKDVDFKHILHLFLTFNSKVS